MPAMTVVGGLGAVLGVPLVLCGYLLATERLLGRVAPRRRAAVRPWLWLAPGLTLLAALLVYPALHTVALSFQNASSTRFVGIANYAYLLSNRNVLLALRNNLLWMVVFTAATVSLGLLIAVLTDRVRYEAVLQAVIFVPMTISFVAAGVIWKFMYQYQPAGSPQVGALNALLTAWAPGFQPQAWLFNPSLNNWALIAVGIWMWTGFAMVICSAALKGIDETLLEAARIEGASEAKIFFHIVLPLMRPTVVVVTTTLVIGVLKVFDIVYVMTNGNLGTDVIANQMYKEMFNFHDFGRASAIATVLLLAILPIMAMNLRRVGGEGGPR